MEYLYPPTHRRVDEPQPEFCDLCGLDVGGSHIAITYVDGLRGQAVCDVMPGCRKFRARMSWRDRRRLEAHEHGITGSSRRIYPAGSDLGFK